MSNRTVQENLDLLIQAKQDIKDAINSRGGTIDVSTPFSEYSVQIDELPTGGGRNWSQIGYEDEPGYIDEGFEYAKYIIGHLDEYPGVSEHSLNFRGDTSLVYLPSCEMLGVDKNNISVLNFNGCDNLQYIADEYLHTEKVQFSSDTFNCMSLKKLPIFDISGGFNNESGNIGGPDYTLFRRGSNKPIQPVLEIIDPSNNTENWYGRTGGFYRLFSGCASLKIIPVMDVKNSIKATSTTYKYTLSQMFENCISLKNVSIINSSHITNMSNMFYYCTSLTNVSQLDTQNVTNMSSMFSYCTSLTTVPELNTQNVTNMYNMFYYCSKLTTIEGLDFKCISSLTNSRLTSYNNTSIRKMYIKNIGYSDCSTYDFSYISNWGVNTTSIPDASLSIYKSLVEDTSTRPSGSTTVNIQLHSTVLNNLDNTTKAAICIKGYTLNGISY